MTAMVDRPLLEVRGLTKYYGRQVGCHKVNFDLWPGEVLGVVGESGSGKTTLLNTLAGIIPADSGSIFYYNGYENGLDITSAPESVRRRLMRGEIGLVRQNPRDGLRMGVSAGANVGERLMSLGHRNYGDIREKAVHWLHRVEIPGDRVDNSPKTFSGGMLQRLQIARNLVNEPSLILMDEPTGGLDVSVQARLLDLLRGLVDEFGLSAVIVTHDLAVVRLLSHRLMVMFRGEVVESGLTDQVLDDPQHPYTQLLVSSVLQA